MRYGRSRNKVMIVALLLVVVTVSIGFAAFSSSLRIKSNLIVSPSDSTFSVLFSSSSSTIETNAITPTVNGNNTTNVVANPATIDNSGTYPTISGLNATIKEKGQSVTYTFYSRNTGSHLAYLTSIVFQELSSGSFIECTAESGTTQSLVTQACEDIDVSVKVGNSSAVTATTLGISDHTLSPNTSEVVTITLSYNSSVLMDGPFKVKIGDIYLTYGTQMTSVSPTFPKPCILTDTDGDKVANTGEVITCGSEKFYTVDSDTTTVTMLAEKNITLPSLNANGEVSDYPKQSDEVKTMSFGGGYWQEFSPYGFATGYPLDGKDFVYDSNSDTYIYVEAYENYLISIGVSSADATLISTSQLEKLGCSTTSCSSNYEWVYSISYWTGSTPIDRDTSIYYVNSSGDLSGYSGSAYETYSIRPLVIISSNELG